MLSGTLNPKPSLAPTLHQLRVKRSVTIFIGPRAGIGCYKRAATATPSRKTQHAKSSKFFDCPKPHHS